jgi:hypothetical protein
MWRSQGVGGLLNRACSLVFTEHSREDSQLFRFLHSMCAKVILVQPRNNVIHTERDSI